ncbi:MAG: T9SS type A sorting domain-containing protein [Candidatus Marinimicrobia bacterium]|jgi:hypothetical protein|nr:T9SS type A sorting domain-containing protein [Candidatus Neomarinimicrobiota bacterium]MBT3848572.1 T9SS type A sorting domain-containing protein [Candidatus Neomarinimicrobiota bacterium]MBT4053599.1 T9SS type A sorting domain-containing protein [Candidatus Neomarinimicrobiota bacterium]MBT4369460.1 T9SS type A sorting domain-containing protein [Candidatus Neomarinimicrobiota bacterium]MBT4660347.1 T9SS type A sorting domain-containing protein [Candidatus Neomarinimicrobiota bacterium]
MIQNILSFLLFIIIVQAQDTTSSCNGWAQETLGPYIIENNIWGQGSINNYTQCIYITEDSSFGWNWDWPNQGYNVKAYPEVIYGKKPWSSQSTHPSLPVKIGDVESFVVDFDLTMSGSGSYNLAFEFWVTSDSMSMEDEITTEVMIWTDQNIIEPAGTQIAIPFFDGYYYNLYQEIFDGWTYFAFVSDTPQHQGTLNVYNFLSYMVALGLLDQDEYIGSFEMGNEVVYGTGSTDIHEFSVSINDNLKIEFSKENISSLTVSAPTPNPFNPSVMMDLTNHKQSEYTISIINLKGEKVYHKSLGVLEPGNHSIKWNGKNILGNLSPSGIYFFVISNSKFIESKKLILLR